MLRTAAIVACALIASCAAPAGGAREQPLRLVAWNLEHLAEHDGAGCRPRTAADYGQLRAYADRLDADVVAFQEVESAAAAARVFDPDKYLVVIESRPGSRVGPECRGRPGLRLNRQATGFAIRKTLHVRRLPDLNSLGLGDPDLRTGVDVVVQAPGGRAIRLLSVHLKSGCSAGGGRDACDVLFRQLPELEEWIDARAGEGVRFAVLGDFNRWLAEPGDSFWAEIDDGSPPNADLGLAAGERSPTCDPRYPRFIDHVVLDARATRDLTGFEERTYGGGSRLSDHCPIVAELRR